jgi:hypothetical protein
MSTIFFRRKEKRECGLYGSPPLTSDYTLRRLLIVARKAYLSGESLFLATNKKGRNEYFITITTLSLLE